jgi:hypothetical protein
MLTIPRKKRGGSPYVTSNSPAGKYFFKSLSNSYDNIKKIGSTSVEVAPVVLDGIAVVTAVPNPPVSMAASGMSFGLTLANDIKKNDYTDTEVAVITNIIGSANTLIWINFAVYL